MNEANRGSGRSGARVLDAIDSVTTPGGDVVTLRKWQREALPVVLAAMRAESKPVVMATMGAGKSIFGGALLLRLLDDLPEGACIVVTTPTVKLVEQLVRTFRWMLGVGQVGAYYTRAKQADRRVVVACNASAEALALDLAVAGRKVEAWIADEAHKTRSPQMRAAVEAMVPRMRLGLTATPYRSVEGERLEQFETVIYEYTVAEAMRDGVIVPTQIIGWSGNDVPLDDAVVEMIRRHGDGPGVVSAYDIEDAEKFAARLRQEEIRADAIHSKQSSSEQADRIARLESGELDALVHVSMLSEGVDFPWLRWLAMRRDVSARVRFVQEAGRVGRAHEGKASAKILDPHGLFERMGLTFEAALGIEDEWEGEAGEKEEREEFEGESGTVDKRRMARPVERVTMYLRELLIAAQSDGVCPPPKYPAGPWRERVASPAQIASVRRSAGASRLLPEPHAEAVAAIIRSGAVRLGGQASDLIDLLSGLARRGAPWEIPIAAAPPSAGDLTAIREEAEADPAVYVAAAIKRDSMRGVTMVGWAAIQHGRPVVLGSAAAPMVYARKSQQGRWEWRKVGLEEGYVKAIGKVHEKLGGGVAIVLPGGPYLPRSMSTYRTVPEGEHPASGVAWRQTRKAASQTAAAAAAPVCRCGTRAVLRRNGDEVWCWCERCAAWAHGGMPLPREVAEIIKERV